MSTYFVNGSKIHLGSNQYVGQGGQAKVYARGKIAYKIFHDPKGMLPTGKMQELEALDPKRFIRPMHPIVDKKGRAVGYTMPLVPNRIPIVQIVTPAYRKRNGLTPEMMHKIIDQIRDGLVEAHNPNILVVDLNEWNLLTDTTHKPLYFIDVDSYQTPHYRATAIMESIRDWKANGQWSEVSDWYSYAIVSFQLYTGIHPFLGRYRGNEAKYRTKMSTDADDDDFAVTRRRMQDGISVLHPDVLIPKAFNLNVIPDAYKPWYRALFVDGNRTYPPSLAGVIFVVPTVRTVTGTDKIDIREVFTVGGDIIGVWERLGTRVVASTQGVWVGSRQVATQPSGGIVVGFTTTTNKPVLAIHQGDRLILTDPSMPKQITLDTTVDDVMGYEGRIYIKAGARIREVLLSDMGGQVVATTKRVAQVLEHASRMFDGCVLQNLLGAAYLNVFPRSGASPQVRMEELDDYKIVDAKFDGGVLMVLGMKGTQYDRLVFRFDQDSWVYDVRVIEDVNLTDLNFITLDSGVALCIDDQERQELFSTRRGSTSLKLIEDPVLGNDMILTREGGRAGFIRGSTLYRMSMR